MLMTMEEYRRETHQFNTFNRSRLLEAYVLGLAGELIELEMAKTLEDQIKEYGDCLWYCAEWLNGYFKTTKLERYPLNEKGFVLCAKELTDILKKGVIRGDYPIMTVHNKVTEIVYAFLKHIDFNLSVTTQDFIYRSNLEKLHDRKNRNVIQGEGDNR